MAYRGYEIEDGAGLTLADIQDALQEHQSRSESCDSQHEGYACTRSFNHTGPHIASISPDTIGAIWEDDTRLHICNRDGFVVCPACNDERRTA